MYRYRSIGCVCVHVYPSKMNDSNRKGRIKIILLLESIFTSVQCYLKVDLITCKCILQTLKQQLKRGKK